MIYLDNAATSLKKPQMVIDAVVHAMQHMGNAGRGSSDSAMQASRIIFQTRQKINDLINGENARQIIFTHNATDSLNTVIKGLFSPNDHIITTVMEHNSVLRPLYELQEQGTELSIIPINSKGIIDPLSIKKHIKHNTKAMIVTHASNVTGNINPIKKIAKVLHDHKLLCIVDASQTMGAIPIDVQNLGLDILCFTGHKSLLGPQGTGGIYVKPSVQIRPLKSGGTGVDTFSHHQPTDYPTALEAGTLNSHGIAGLSAALDYLNNIGIQAIRDQERQLLDYFVSKLSDIEDIQLYGSFEPKQDRCGIVSINLGKIDSAIIVEELIERQNIITRGGGHCAPLMHKALGTDQQGVVRFSLSHYTEYEELDTVIDCLKEIMKDMQ
ncbi:aminotransferase class V-fold PLP-dependent enzyme [Facklamia lactis]|uniref:aminotransferase class V-fold PLP-dependent enzyme n=1 Tax=Facklamia lactis TaxID=2749967 RepID=UPI0018CE1D6E|nr:aminotransferase class V-fold PLP-dependent enzyme [Facklamia lactis]MBG9980285.1 aminotransferase class V-fold PLP-dependent enzyme [Facklamia lactis]